MKRVRVTLELTERFVKLLYASCQLANILPKMDGTERAQLTPIELIAMLVLAEARGAPEEQIASMIPLEWRDAEIEPQVVHDQRQVIEA